MAPLVVDIWSDIACPWCWIGKRRLEAAIESLDFEVELCFRAFQLNPSAPRSFAGDPDYVGRLAKKYGRRREDAQSMIDNMRDTGALEGLDFAFDKVLPVNTFDGHRLLALAKSKSLQVAAKERLLRAYFEEGQDLCNAQVLAEIGAEVGLEIDSVLAMLSGDAFSDEVDKDRQRAAELQITGVPFFLIGGRLAVSGAQSSETLAKVLSKAASVGVVSEAAR